MNKMNRSSHFTCERCPNLSPPMLSLPRFSLRSQSPCAQALATVYEVSPVIPISILVELRCVVGQSFTKFLPTALEGEASDKRQFPSHVRAAIFYVCVLALV